MLQVALRRSPDVDYSIEHWHGHALMTMRTTDTPNSRLVIAPLDDLSQQKELRPHRAEVQLEDVSVSQRHIALLERVNGLSECHVFSLPEPDQAAFVRPSADAGRSCCARAPCRVIPCGSSQRSVRPSLI